MADLRTNQRIHYLDSGRALASILGIFYHSALVFSVPWVVNVNAAEFSPGLYLFQYVLSTFRMPLFLLVAGYFTQYALAKHDLGGFVIHRARRIVLPFVTAIFTLLPVQLYFILLFKYGDSSRQHYLESVNPFSATFSLGHLWFLYDLTLYALLVCIVASLRAQYQPPAGLRRFVTLMHQRPATALMFWSSVNVFTTMVAGIVGSRLHADNAWLPVGQLGHNLPMFLFGCYCHSHVDTMNTVLRASFGRLVATFLLLALLVPLSIHLGPLAIDSDRSPAQVLIVTAMDVVIRWLATVGVVGLLRLLLNRRFVLLDYLSDVSYPVYLFHHPVIIVIAYAYVTLQLHLPTGAGYALVCAASLITTYLSVELFVNRTTATSLLFTGVRRPQRMRAELVVVPSPRRQIASPVRDL